MNAKKNPKQPCVYKLKVTLKDLKPPIWRRLLVRGDDTLADLHDVIQISMGWMDYHLHEFTVGKTQYGTQDDDSPSEVFDDGEYTLDEVLGGKKTRFTYLYDFGDGWTMDVVVESIEPLDPEKQYPVCLAGKRHGPMEDSGGPWGYAQKVETLKNPDDPYYEQIAEWMGADWDAEYFDRDELNVELQQGDLEDTVDLEDLGEEERDALLESMLDEDPFLEERVARLHDQIGKAHGLGSPEAVHDFIEAMSAEALRDFAMKQLNQNPEDAAFEFGLLALEAQDLDEAIGLADKALELDPRSVDARIVRSNVAVAEGNYDDGIALLREALAIAKDNLGEEFFTQFSGEFADHVQTRPYLRVRFLLGHTLQETDQVEEAADHYRDMLEKDSDDSMGARYPLAGVLLQMERLEEVRALAEEYSSDDDMIFPWAEVLERYLSGEEGAAEDLLEGAIAANPLMATSLLDFESAADLDTDTDLGVAAAMALAAVGKAWIDHPKALEWLDAKVYAEDD